MRLFWIINCIKNGKQEKCFSHAILFRAHSTQTPFQRWMLKAPPLNPWTCISRSSKIYPTEGHKYVLKFVRKSSKISKKVDNDATCLIIPISGQTLVLYPYWLIFSTSGQTSGLYRSNLLSNILYAPNVANLGFWKI